MNTCLTVARRQESLAERVARANQLLTTRVNISVERQNQALLESMDRRAKAQFKLQQTVEGLSVAAITYYVVGLIGYGAKALHARGFDVDYEWVQGLSIPIVLLLIGAGTYFLKHRLTRHLRSGLQIGHLSRLTQNAEVTSAGGSRVSRRPPWRPNTARALMR
jgi:uncharacterized membrane-anchored protein